MFDILTRISEITGMIIEYRNIRKNNIQYPDWNLCCYGTEYQIWFLEKFSIFEIRTLIFKTTGLNIKHKYHRKVHIRNSGSDGYPNIE